VFTVPSNMPPTNPPALPRDRWLHAREDYLARIEAWLTPQQTRRAHGLEDPVCDFLFEYYSFRASALLRWSPGINVILADAHPNHFSAPHAAFVFSAEEMHVCARKFPAQRRASLDYIQQLLTRSRERPLHLGCFGLHEWAMVYRTTAPRHSAIPLRLPPADIARIVESNTLCCTHFDAFRFFTPDAAPKNRWALQRTDQSDFEQPGCIHATMDLYKWAFKIWPWIAGGLLADCFALAIDARTIDMRASPYDLRAFGLQPIVIETPDGQTEYQDAQRTLATRAAPLRAQLINTYAALIHSVATPSCCVV